MSDSTSSKPIFDIKATEENTSMYTPIMSGSETISYLLVLCLQKTNQKAWVAGLVSDC